MNKSILVPHYNDLLCCEIFKEEERPFCDCCDEEIKEGENIGDEEDFCAQCYESGGISRYLKKQLNFNFEWHYHVINIIKNNYDKLKLK